MKTEQKLKQNYYFNNFETKFEANVYNNISIPINLEDKQNEENNLNGRFFPFIFEEDNNEDLLFIQKDLLSDKQNEISLNNNE